MGRPPYGARATCESCKWIDVRRWHREGRLRADQSFSCSWTRGGELSGSINVRTEGEAVIVMHWSRSWGTAEWKSVEQRVPITWTDCHLGGRRPWFVCSAYPGGKYCGRRVAVLFGAGHYFACRHCYGLAYLSQQEPIRERGCLKARKIRMLLGGDPNVLEACPEKPPRMHWRTYKRLYLAYQNARGRCVQGIIGTADSLHCRMRV